MSIQSELAGGFAALGLSSAALAGVRAAGYESPTPVQAQAIPPLLAGRDVVAQAQTGTGKTAAFALPLVDRLDPETGHPQALVLCPTRELAVQVSEAIYGLAQHRGLRVLPIYGGQPIDRQLRGLRSGVQIVVGTPGRLLDHLRRGSLDLSGVRSVVLDEADEMLAMGFIEDIEAILAELPEERQVALFSATLPPPIARLAERYLRDPTRIGISTEARSVPLIRQSYYEVLPGKKLDALCRVLDMETPGPTIVFCKTRRDADLVGEYLRGRGYLADTLHGDMGQPERDRVMKRFRAGQAELLVATDVAARGLDIETVTHVINYDIPWDVESYTHRIGRTGRAGREGDAITLVTPRERRQLHAIQRATGVRMTAVRVPTSADIAARRRELFKERVAEIMESREAEPFLMLVEELSREQDASEVAAAALMLLWNSGRNAPELEEGLETETRAEPGMTRLFIPVGRDQGIRPNDLVGAIANEAGLPGREIGSIDILDRCSFVEVPEGAARRVQRALERTSLRGIRVRVEIAPPGFTYEPAGSAPEPPHRPRSGAPPPRRPGHRPGPPAGPRRRPRSH